MKEKQTQTRVVVFVMDRCWKTRNGDIQSGLFSAFADGSGFGRLTRFDFAARELGEPGERNTVGPNSHQYSTIRILNNRNGDRNGCSIHAGTRSLNSQLFGKKRAA